MKIYVTLLGMVTVACPAAGQKKPSAPAPKQQEPISITIGEGDLSPSQPSQSSKAASDKRVEQFRREVLKEIADAEAAARAAATPEEAFPHRVKVAFLDAILDDYVKAQYAWATMPKDLFAAVGQAKSVAELEALERSLAESAEIFDGLVVVITDAPSKIGDELLTKNYDVTVIKQRLPEVLKSSPLPVFRTRYQTLEQAARAASNFVSEARRNWGKWIVQEGNLGLSEKLTLAEREQFEEVALAAKAAMSKAKDAR